MNNQPKAPPSRQVMQLTQELNSALIRKEVLTDQLDALNDQIKAMRNVLGGIELGKEFAAELAEQKKAEVPQTKVAP